MRIVAMDTTGAFGSLALLENGSALEEMPLHSGEGFSTVLFDRLRSLLARHDWQVASVDCFASASGPGSFTGVRVGLAAVKSLAEATGSAAIGVSTLEALAACGSSPVRAAVMDARRGEVYGAVYESESGLLMPEVVAAFPEWIASLPENVTEIVAADFAPFRPHYRLSLPVSEVRTLAVAVARVAVEKIHAGQDGDPARLDANYVRRADAELRWRDGGSL